jgi:hypothetical protein
MGVSKVDLSQIRAGKGILLDGRDDLKACGI